MPEMLNLFGQNISTVSKFGRFNSNWILTREPGGRSCMAKTAQNNRVFIQ
jgi:hypothetical protein